MILKDIITEYKFVYMTLLKCEEYFTIVDNIISISYTDIFNATSTFFQQNTSDTNNRNSFINSLSIYFNSRFTDVTLLATQNFEFYGSLKLLETHNFSNRYLSRYVCKFIDDSHELIHILSDILIGKAAQMKTSTSFSLFLQSLQETSKDYHTLMTFFDHLDFINNSLLEPIPDNVSMDDIQFLELRSSKENVNFLDFAEDIQSLSSFLQQLDILLSRNKKYSPIFTRKIETGSLRIVWGGNSIEISCIADIISAITNAISSFRLIGIQKKWEQERTRELKLNNDQKALAIINSQIDVIASKLNLDTSNPEDVETIQRLCLPLIRYINNNPVGSIGDYNYNISNELKLLEDFYFKPSNDE